MSRANTCGTQAYLFICKLECFACFCLCWSGPFVCVENGDAKGSNQTDAKSTYSTADSDCQAFAIHS